MIQGSFSNDDFDLLFANASNIILNVILLREMSNRGGKFLNWIILISQTTNFFY